MINAILGQKVEQTQKFLADGRRIPVTRILVTDNPVIAVKTMDKHGYSSIQLGFGTRKHASKAILGKVRGANLKTAPRFFREIRIDEAEMPKVGDLIKVADVFRPGDTIDVSAVSKGKGFAGVVKRHHFKGGPRTHGQSDRERAPGSIGQTTTPGRVYKGKRMAGRMGGEKATIKNLEVIDVSQDSLLIKGLIPGGKNSLVMVKKIGENKKFVPLYQEEGKKETIEIEAEGKSQESEAQEELESKVEEKNQSHEAESAASFSENGQPLIANTEDVKEDKKENAS